MFLYLKFLLYSYHLLKQQEHFPPFFNGICYTKQNWMVLWCAKYLVQLQLMIINCLWLFD